MLIQPVDYFLVVWFVLAAASTAYVAVDQFRNNPEPTVMKWGFILVTLYMGPFGLLLYVMADKEPRPGEHEKFVAPLWRQGVGSTIHCVAGDATGIILAAVVTATLGLPMWVDLIVEYLAGFAFGLFIFQSLFMKSMMGGTYWENVRKSFTPEFISMNFMMAGMAPVMSLLMMGRDMRAMDPTELLFWGVMSLGVMAGFALAYPVNVWMVAQKIKHGLMTERKPGSRFDMAKPEPKARARRAGAKSAAATAGAHASHASKGAAAPDESMPGMDMGDDKKSATKQHNHADGMKSGMTRPQLAAVGGVSVLLFLTGMAAPANFVNMRLSAKDVGGTIMPRGMVMDRDTPGEAMRDMSAVHPRYVTAEYGLDKHGDQELAARIENGVKVFDLETSVIRWQILPNVSVMEGGMPNYFTINGRAYPETDTIKMKVGETLKVRFIGSNSGFIHPMHIHGGPFEVVARDGESLAPAARYKADTVNVGPGQRYDVVWTARKSGKWMIHCHISHHTTNNNVETKGGGGLMMHIEVEGDPTS
jgi:hypothetical protein